MKRIKVIDEWQIEKTHAKVQKLLQERQIRLLAHSKITKILLENKNTNFEKEYHYEPKS